MGYFVIKVNPERDAYLVFHSSTDTVCAYGTRKQMKKVLFHFDDRKKSRIREEDRSHPETMLATADLKGSSSWFDGGRWDDDEITYCAYQDGKGQQRLPRANFEAVFDRFVSAEKNQVVNKFPKPDLQDLLLDHEDD